MVYTFEPQQKYAKASGSNVRVSTKSSVVICRAIRNKPLRRARRLLEDLSAGRRSLDGKYYTKSVDEILNLVNSCEKNAEFLGLETGRLFVHASASQGTNYQRRRRKASFGSKMKTTHIEVYLIEKGRGQKDRISAKKIKESKKKETDAEKKIKSEQKEMKRDIDDIKEKQKETKGHVKNIEKEAKEKTEKTQEKSGG